MADIDAALPNPSPAIKAAVDREDVPVLDIGSVLAGLGGALAQAAADVRYIQRHLGFYYIENHGVDQTLIDAGFAQLRKFFDQPMGEKLKLRVNRHQIGYVPPHASVMKTALTDVNKKPDTNEGLGFMRERAADDPKVVADVRFSGRNQWPDSLPGFRETFLAYHAAMERLGQSLLPIYAVALGKPAEFFAPFFEDAHYYNRNSHYPATDAEEGQHSIGAHTDHNFMALLPMSAVPALEVERPSGGWVEAPIVPGAIVVNTGEFLNRWSNGVFRAIPHRVIIPTRDRYALTFHYNPMDDAVAAPLDTCISDENPPQFDPKTFIQHMTDYIDASYKPLREGT
ncbi:MAG: isopenicillin N synthase family oxygenase [Rhodospirillaceae bacterium]|jgi:isopenicillin N synthase-like dioxygenase|nr:isopenicillin N synthase family oxygenase [Rhodospirillaceae bacterium]MBT4773394.1 isopenicillin N synthase family oxygenase [Rhodospirillaceae bacterium]MBT5359778.1 isopenicillin N synthase family oxygenase [Rhodospirillaceae bacterium]MBT5768540.1 isopenicillin N synthase family oxygenase [Rhodospirillaceae bacterium]MBT6311197.1 isopenicillin N synthase family oxygenase [Rhodospirillaceae bacterium]